jgi:hypothetical protein
LNSSIKSKIRVSSFSGGLGSGIAEVGDGSGKDSNSAIWDSSSKNFSLSSRRSCKIFVRMLLPYSAETCMNKPSTVVLRYSMVFLVRPMKKCWRRIDSRMLRSRLELRRVLEHSHALPRDSFFFCLKVRTST